jgi:hypothetical protein
MGISYPVMLNDPTPVKVEVPNPDYEPPEGGRGGDGYGGYPGGMGGSGPAGSGGIGGGEGMGGGLLGPGGMGGFGSGDRDEEEELDITEKPTLEVRRFSFDMQFFWQPQPLEERLRALEEKRKAEEEAAEQAEPSESAPGGENVAMNSQSN